MNFNIRNAVGVVFVCVSVGACVEKSPGTSDSSVANDSSGATQSVAERMAKYTTVALVADTTNLTPKERQMIPLLIAAARLMDPIYWMQSYGNRDSLMATVTDSATKEFLDVNYQPSDLAWMDMKNNTIDIVIGPIETYEDELYGYKAANEAYVLIKDKTWSQRLAKYAAMLPALQKGLPVADAYKKETPGTDSDL